MLGGLRAASSNLLALADQGKDLSLQMSLGFQVRNNPRLRSVHGGGAGSDGAAGGFQNFVSGISKTLRKIGDALAPQKYDTLNFKRRGLVEVPRGHSVSEREWAELKADRKVTFSPRIGVSSVKRGE